jgi:hypothetical protein
MATLARRPCQVIQAIGACAQSSAPMDQEIDTQYLLAQRGFIVTVNCVGTCDDETALH